MCFKFGTIQEVRENILARTLNILRPWRRKEGYGTLSYTLEGKWDSIAKQMVARFSKKRVTQYSRASVL